MKHFWKVAGNVMFTTLVGYATVEAQQSPAVIAARPHPHANSAADDYAPCRDLDGAGLLLTTERGASAQVIRCLPSGNVELVAGSFNRPGMARGYVTLDASGSGYGCAYRAGSRQSTASIVRLSRTASTLDAGEPLSEVADDSYSAQPSVAPDGNRLLYVSDREGGLGGLDLWMLERRVDGTWSAPQHAGEALNSPGDDVSPFLMASDTLIFASNGMGGQGGYDLYMSVYRNGKWADPEPLDELNSSSDETDAIILADGMYCFASNRPGGRGGFDLWLWGPKQQR